MQGRLEGLGNPTPLLLSHPTAISVACLKPSFERILSDDVHEEVEPHDWQGQPDHWDLEQLCGEKGWSEVTALLLLKEDARSGVSLLSRIDRDPGHAAASGGRCCIRQTEVWAHFDFVPN